MAALLALDSPNYTSPSLRLSARKPPGFRSYGSGTSGPANVHSGVSRPVPQDLQSPWEPYAACLFWWYLAALLALASPNYTSPSTFHVKAPRGRELGNLYQGQFWCGFLASVSLQDTNVNHLVTCCDRLSHVGHQRSLGVSFFQLSSFYPASFITKAQRVREVGRISVPPFRDSSCVWAARVYQCLVRL